MVEESSTENLPKVLPPEERSAAENVGSEDDLAELESTWLNQSLSQHAIEAAALKNKLAQAYIDNLDADRTMRQTYAGRILKYLEYYSGGVLVLLLLAGIERIKFTLDEGVLLTLVGSTAVAAIGLVGFIARGLFKSPPMPPSDYDN